MTTQALDPITLQVISGALNTIAEEMGHILYRMSFSSIIGESQDLIVHTTGPWPRLRRASRCSRP